MKTVDIQKTETIDGRTYTFTVAVPRTEAFKALKARRNALIAESLKLDQRLTDVRKRKVRGARALTLELTSVRAELAAVNSKIRDLQR